MADKNPSSFSGADAHDSWADDWSSPDSWEDSADSGTKPSPSAAWAQSSFYPADDAFRTRIDSPPQPQPGVSATAFPTISGAPSATTNKTKGWIIPVAIIAAAALVGVGGTYAWLTFSHTGGDSYAAGTPKHVSTTTLGSLNEAKTSDGFTLSDEFGKQFNARSVAHGNEQVYATSSIASGDSRVVRVFGQTANGKDGSAIVALEANGATGPALKEIPVPADATCVVDEQKIQCDNRPALALADLVDSQGNTKSGVLEFNPNYARNIQYPRLLAGTSAHDLPPEFTIDLADLAADVAKQLKDETGPVWIFTPAKPADKAADKTAGKATALDTVVLSSAGIKSFHEGRIVTDYSGPRGFAEINKLDTMPTPVLAGNMIVFGTSEGVHGLDVTTGDTPWDIATPVSDWTINDGEILTVHHNTVNLFELKKGKTGKKTQTVSPPTASKKASDKPATKKEPDFYNDTYEVPLPSDNSSFQEHKSFSFSNGEAPYSFNAAPGLSLDTTLRIANTTPVIHDDETYTLVEFEYEGLTGRSPFWVIYDRDEKPQHAWDHALLTQLPSYGPPGEYKPSSPTVDGDTFYYEEKRVSTPGDPQSGSCDDTQCSISHTKVLKWQGDDIVPVENVFSINGRTFKMPKDSDVQALLDAWAMRDPEIARPYIDDLDSFMRQVNQHLGGGPQTPQSTWSYGVFRDQKGTLKYCDLVNARNQMASHSDYLILHNTEPGEIVCIFDAASHTPAAAASDRPEPDALTLTTDENGHILRARLHRSWG